MRTRRPDQRKAVAPGGLTQRDQRLVWRIAAVLLDYPTQQTFDLLDDLSAAAATLPAPCYHVCRIQHTAVVAGEANEEDGEECE